MSNSPSGNKAGASAPGQTFALITGASSGIGACFARALAARGRNLVLVARSGDKLTALRSDLSAKHSVRIELIEQDLSVAGAAKNLVAVLKPRDIAVELLVNNAGFGAHGEFWTLPLDRQIEMLQLNIVALTELTHLLIPAMIERRGGGIINISSTASFQPVPYTSVYSATKAYVTSFSMGIAEELAPYGVKVLALCPGGTATNFFDASQYSKREFPGGLQSPEQVVELGLRAYDRGESLCITRFINGLMVFAERFAPRRLVAREAAKAFKPKSLVTGK